MRDETNEVATNSRKKNITNLYGGIRKFMRGYQPRSNLVNHENGDLLADSQILNRWKNYFSQLLNVHRVSNVFLLWLFQPILDPGLLFSSVIIFHRL
jgi:hypothetical protein